MKTLTPFGVSDVLPDGVDRRDRVTRKLKSVFQKARYRPIITPTFEYFETLKHALSEKTLNRCIRFFDHQGELIVLRPDHTAPIARVVATQMKAKTDTQRLYYMGSVFRKASDDTGSETEFFQAGCELIGESGPEAEAEVLEMAIRLMQSLGIKNFGIDIGHTQFLKTLSKSKQAALMSGQFIKLDELPKRGNASVVADQPDLQQIYKLMKKKGLESYISFNRGVVRDFTYYTGPVFECYIEGIGTPVGSGGRYDHLVGKFGDDRPAVGMALNVDLLLQASRKAKR